MSSQNYDPYTQGWYLLPVQPPTLSTPSAIPSLTSGQVAELNAHTLQGLIENVYVRVGNDVLYRGLNGLDVAINATTQTLNIMAGIQQFHNALVTSGLGSFSSWFNFAASSNAFGGVSQATAYQAYYNAAASAFFGIPIVPDFIFKQKLTDDGSGGQRLTIPPVQIGPSLVTYDEYASRLAALRNQLSQQVQTLSQINAGNPSVLQDPNSLYSTTKQVLDQMPPEQPGGGPPAIAWTDAKLWVLDGQTIQDGKDLAQTTPTQIVITYDNLPAAGYQNMNIAGLGVGDGVLPGGATARGAGGTLLLNVKGMMVTYSGRMAIESGGYTLPNTKYAGGVIAINPVDPNNAVVNPLVSGSKVQGSSYLGSFGARVDAAQAGLIQQNITLAITAGQGLNDTQTQQVRSFMFTFEEYYKSASAMLNTITQLINKFAEGIRPA